MLDRTEMFKLISSKHTYLTVFVCSTQKENLSSTQSHKPSQNVTCRACVGMANVRLVIDVVNWRCDLKGPLSIVGGCGGSSQNIGGKGRAAATPNWSLWRQSVCVSNGRWCCKGLSQLVARQISPALPYGWGQDWQNNHCRESHDSIVNWRWLPTNDSRGKIDAMSLLPLNRSLDEEIMTTIRWIHKVVSISFPYCHKIPPLSTVKSNSTMMCISSWCCRTLLDDRSFKEESSLDVCVGKSIVTCLMRCDEARLISGPSRFWHSTCNSLPGNGSYSWVPQVKFGGLAKMWIHTLSRQFRQKKTSLFTILGILAAISYRKQFLDRLSHQPRTLVSRYLHGTHHS